MHKIELVLPEGLVCEHCSFRWHYRAGNNWGICSNGMGRMGCGPQETYRQCADVEILPSDSVTEEDTEIVTENNPEFVTEENNLDNTEYEYFY